MKAPTRTPPDRDEMARILIVDDEATLVGIHSRLFSMMNYLVETACNGRECLERVRDSAPDVILLDLEMPVMNGLEVLERLGEERDTVGIPVVMVSGCFLTTELENKLRQKRNLKKFLSKPVDFETILTEVNNALAGAGAVQLTMEE